MTTVFSISPTNFNGTEIEQIQVNGPNILTIYGEGFDIENDQVISINFVNTINYYTYKEYDFNIIYGGDSKKISGVITNKAIDYNRGEIIVNLKNINDKFYPNDKFYITIYTSIGLQTPINSNFVYTIPWK